MALRFLVSILALSLAAAADYDYNNLNTQVPTSPQLNNMANDLNAFSAATSIVDSEPTPDGYDYISQTMQAQQVQQAHTTASNQQQQRSNQNLSPSQSTELQQQQQLDVAAPVEYWPAANYEYSYSVDDPNSGDIKSHSESRVGNLVRGSYRLVDPDGYERIVTYTADDVNGFNAVVSRIPYVSAMVKATSAVDVDGSSVGSETQQNRNIHNDNISQSDDSLVESRDAYATPTTQQQNGGPYP